MVFDYSSRDILILTAAFSSCCNDLQEKVTFSLRVGENGKLENVVKVIGAIGLSMSQGTLLV
jgi:hypothetical protein